MSREQLDRAYSLIKSGQTQEAIDIIETIIRADRDNENAWWLLVNATDDPAAKRNALNNVIRLTQNAQRADKARVMLQSLDNDSYGFDNKPTIQAGRTAYQGSEKAQQSSGRSGCGKIVIAAMAIIGLCACISIIGLFWAARPIFDAIQIPDSYDNQGILEGSLNTEGSLRADSPVDGYIYQGIAGETLDIRVDSTNQFPPFIFIYDTDTGVPIGFAQGQTPNSPAQLSIVIPETGDYLITVYALTLLGQDMGYGDYSMSFEVR
jgi:hypothetical protein